MGCMNAKQRKAQEASVEYARMQEVLTNHCRKCDKRNECSFWTRKCRGPRLRIVKSHPNFCEYWEPVNMPETTPDNMTVTLVSIAKNEEDSYPKLVESCRGLVDRIVLVDTGSTDSTIKVAESLGAEVRRIIWDNDFSKARNEALKLAGDDSTWIIMLDCDNIVEDAAKWRETLAAQPADVKAVTVRFETGPGHKMGRTCIWRPGEVTYRYRAHNKTVVKSGKLTKLDLLLKHPGKLGRPMDRDRMPYLMALKKDLEENAEDASRWYYYGRMLGLNLDPQGIYVMVQCAQRTHNPYEAGMAYAWGGVLCEKLEVYELAMWMFHQSVEIAPFLRDGYCGIMRNSSNRAERYGAACSALSVTEPSHFDSNPKLYSPKFTEWITKIRDTSVPLEPTHG